ncbi:hypothetical protein PAPYR_13477 [Paratrimastix pyriformis]|uniref:Uncharacterized protein n=1 Tax=Paratrimastix pyriformis TaxID=342808 RepID=A0ABQ8U530_9EUKA|nr:hypothetical protein PAPYR_13477 [Paratrimastix pyriformis]
MDLAGWRQAWLEQAQLGHAVGPWLRGQAGAPGPLVEQAGTGAAMGPWHHYTSWSRPAALVEGLLLLGPKAAAG